MQRIDFQADRASPITRYDSIHASAVALGDGEGEAHVHAVYIEPGGVIGPHPAGFGQLLLVVQGSGWVTGPDGERCALTPGTGVYIAPGELHAKGSDHGLVAVMVQVRSLAPSPEALG